ncbi:MAG: TolC family protein [Clostridiaceae bacterium]|nr:TolC family protein [Clostridiaceae bacterium]
MRYIFITLLLIVFPKSFSQSALNSNDCLDYAYEHNFEIQEFCNNINKSRLDLKQSYLNTLPSVNAEYNHYLSSGRSLNVETYSWDNEDIQQGNMALSAELVVFKGLYNLYSQQANRIALEKYEFALQQKKLLLGLNIILLFHKVSLNNSTIAILTLTHSGTKEEIKKLEEQITAGTMAKSNIYELQAQAKKEELEILASKNEKEKNLNNLSKLLNWQESTGLELNTVLPENYNDTVFHTALLNNTIVEQSVITYASEKDLELAKKAIQLKMSGLYPSLMANASLSSRYLNDAVNLVSGDNYTYFNQLDNNQYKQLVITLSIPIFNRHQTATEIRQLNIEYENKNLQYENIKRQLLTELSNIETDILYLKNKITETKAMVEAYKQSYQVAIEKHRSGLLDLYTLNTSKNNFTASSLQLNRLYVELSMNVELLKLYLNFTVK